MTAVTLSLRHNPLGCGGGLVSRLLFVGVFSYEHGQSYTLKEGGVGLLFRNRLVDASMFLLHRY